MWHFCRRYFDDAAGEANKTIRWRAVHVLGAYPSSNSLKTLQKALRDEYHWVQYGAARSLIEIAARSQSQLRTEALNTLREFLIKYDAPDVWVRRQVLEEIVQAAFIRDAEPGWKDAMEPILQLAAERETEPGAQEKLQPKQGSATRCNRRGSDSRYEIGALESIEFKGPAWLVKIRVGRQWAHSSFEYLFEDRHSRSPREVVWMAFLMIARPGSRSGPIL